MNNYKNKFETVLRDDENVLWTGAVNISAYVKTMVRNMALWMLFPFFLPFMLLALTIFLPVTLHYIRKNASNTFLCITDKQIIKRKGIFRNDYQRVSLSAIGEININGNIFDSKEPNMSASLHIRSKSYSSGETRSGSYVIVNNLKFANEAYKVISKNSDNDALKIRQI